MATAKELMDTARKKIEENKARASKIGAVYKFVLAGDGGGTFIVNLKDNPAIIEGDGPAECTIKMKGKHYVALVEGRKTPRELFLAGKLTIKGEMGVAMKLEELADMIK
jgi:putative sterol carrier protein